MATKITKKVTTKTPAKKVATKTVAKKAKPVKEEKEVVMTMFTCKSCKQKFPDTGSYFFGKKSEKCIWCTKFPKRK
jgi:hypothetical protein